MLSLKKIFFLFLLTAAIGTWAKNEAIVRNSADLINMQNELANLKKSNVNQQQLDELWKRSQRIAEMNDKCGTISFTEAMDPECSKFYITELPQFEDDFMKITGEIRLGNMSQSISKLKARAENLSICADALSQFLLNPEQMMTLKMNSELILEPLNRDATDIDVYYDFTLSYDKRRMRTIKKLAEMWVGKCGEIVLNPEKNDLAPLFKKSIEELNSNASNSGNAIDATVFLNDFHVIFRGNGFSVAQYKLGGRTLFSHDRTNIQYLLIDLSPQNGGTVDYYTNDYDFKGKENVYIVGSAGYEYNNLEGRLVWEKRAYSYNAYNSNNNYYPYEEESSSSSDDYYSNYSGYYAQSSSSYSPYDYSNNDEDDGEEESSNSGLANWQNARYSYGQQENNNPQYDAPSNVHFRVSAVTGVSLAEGQPTMLNENAKILYPELMVANEKDTISFVQPYVAAMLHMDIKDFELGFGGGIAWNILSLQEYSGGYGGDSQEYNILSGYAPMIMAEIAYMTVIDLKELSNITLGGGLRGAYIMDSEIPTLNIAPFIELGCVGMEIGYQYAQDFWSNVYVGMYLRFPSKALWKTFTK